MSNAQRGKDWYESPTEITRSGKTYYFIGRVDSFTQDAIIALKHRARRSHISLRTIYNNDYEPELWATSSQIKYQALLRSVK